MSAPKTRGQAIATKCRQCIHDPQAFGTWREQVAACASTNCPLWRFRPVQVSKSVPHWIKARDPDALPEGFTGLDQAEAVRAMRAKIAARASRGAVQANGSACSTYPLPTHRVGAA